MLAASPADRARLPPAARETLGSTVRYLGMTLDTHSAASWLGALAVAALGFAAFEFVRRRFALEWGRIQGEIEATMAFKEPNAAFPRAAKRLRAKRTGARHERPTPAVELKDLRKSFGKTEIIRGTDLAVAPASASPSSARTAPASRRSSISSAAASARRAARSCSTASASTAEAVRDQPPRPGAELPDHQHLRAPVGVREPALRPALVDGLPLRVLEVPGRPARTPTTAPSS
jgi:hypothetical protein